MSLSRGLGTAFVYQLLHPALHRDTVTRDPVDHLLPKEEERRLAAWRSLPLPQSLTSQTKSRALPQEHLRKSTSSRPEHLLKTTS